MVVYNVLRRGGGGHACRHVHGRGGVRVMMMRPACVLAAACDAAAMRGGGRARPSVGACGVHI